MDLQCTVHKHVNSNYIYFNSLAPAHDEATMALEGHSRQTLGEVVCWLMLTCNLIIFYLRLVSRSEFLDWIDTSVDMLGARIHTTPRKIHALLNCAMRVGAVCSYPRSSIIRLRYTRSSAHCDPFRICSPCC